MTSCCTGTSIPLGDVPVADDLLAEVDAAVHEVALIRRAGAYPAPMFVDLFRLLPSHPAILEVGPGTGQATRDLLSRGATVHAIEIGPAMAAKLREALPSPALTITIGDFEEADVEEHEIGRASCRERV